ncbi:MAG: GNAT family N-acetyltransferase [Clostridia bacterium]
MLTIRELTSQDDFDEVGRIYAESWKHTYRGLLPQRYLDKLTHDRWSSMLRAAPSKSLGLFVDGAIVGTSMVDFAREAEREGYGEIISIYLLPGAMGQGYGKQLMQAALCKLQSLGCEDAFLWAFTRNLSAEGFYEYMGFSRTGRIQKESFGGSTLELSEFCIHL